MATQNHLFLEEPFTGVLVAQAVGIIASGYLFGQNAGISFITIPAIMKAPPALAIQQWSAVYNVGHYFGPTLSLLGGFSTGYVAYSQDRSTTAGMLNLAASILFLSISPYTVIAIFPTNNKLFEREKKIAVEAASAKDVENEAKQRGETTHELISRWSTLHLIRSFLTGAGVVCAVWAAVNGGV